MPRYLYIAMGVVGIVVLLLLVSLVIVRNNNERAKTAPRGKKVPEAAQPTPQADRVYVEQPKSQRTRTYVEQPTPKVSRADVERVIRRDFPGDRFGDVIALINMYNASERDRVQLAALKLADGDERELQRGIESANFDYRDVLSEAEYPRYSRAWSRIDRLSDTEKKQIIDDDWSEYQHWLHR